jgi:hypothetical protein
MVSFTTKNYLPASTSSITINFNNYYSISTSAYCRFTTLVSSNDGRGIMCLRTSSTMITLSNLGTVPVGSVFSVYVKLVSSLTTSISPTISIITYYTGTYQVDTLLNQAHSSNPIPNSGLLVLPSFVFQSPQIV